MKNKKKIIILGVTLVLLAGGTYILAPNQKITLGADAQKIVWDKPTTDAEWAEDVKVEGFNHKLDYQLDEMKANLEEKLPKFLKDYTKYTDCPECVEWDIKENLEVQKFEGDVNKEIDRVYQEQLDHMIWEIEKIKQSIERIDNEKRLRAGKKVNRDSEIMLAKPSTEREKIEHDKLNNKIR